MAKNFRNFRPDMSRNTAPASPIFSMSKLASFLSLALLLSACIDQPGTHKDAVFDLSQYQGKWLVINYWAIWCSPCADEMPELNALQREHEKTLTVLGVNYDEKTGEELLADIRAIGMEFDYVEKNPANVLRLSRPEGLPVTYLFSPEGELAAKLVGPQTKAEILQRIDLLQAPKTI